MHLNSEYTGYSVPGDKSAVMHHTALQLDPHLWIWGHQFTIVMPVYGGHVVYQSSSTMERQLVTFKDHLTLGWKEWQGVQL